MDCSVLRLGSGDLGGRRDGRHHDVRGNGESAGGEGERLRVVSWGATCYLLGWRCFGEMVYHREHTTAMRHNALFSNLVQAVLLNQACNCVECAAYFECAYALEILTLEEEIDFGLCGLLALPLRALQRFGRLRCRRKVSQCGVG